MIVSAGERFFPEEINGLDGLVQALTSA